MSWWSATLEFVMAVAVLFIPGLIVVFAARLRGIFAVAVAPVISASLIAVAAIAAPFVHLQWGVLPVLLLTLIVAVVAFVMGYIFRQNPRTIGVPKREHVKAQQRPSWTTRWYRFALAAFALTIPAALIGRRLLSAIGRPDAISQTYDNVFHLNAVRYILETGNGSSLTLNKMIGADFYPAAWHDVIALVVQLTGGQAPVVVNTVALVIACTVWPLGCMAMVQQIFGSRMSPVLIAGVLSAAFGSFPILLLNFGVLYPNFFGNALLPATFAVCIPLLGFSRLKPAGFLVTLLVLVATLPGLSFAHPSTLMALIASSIVLLVIATIRKCLAIARGGRRLTTKWWLCIAAVVGSIVYFLVALKIWVSAQRPPAEAFWPPIEAPGQAIGEIISSSPRATPIAWVIMLLTVVGLVFIIARRRHLWLLGAYLPMVALFLVVASDVAGANRSFYTGLWYNDPPRLASLLPFATIPIAAVGALRLWDQVVALTLRWVDSDKLQRSNRWRLQTLTSVGVVAAVLLTGVLALGTQRCNVRAAAKEAANSYSLTENSPLLSSDEYALLKRLPQEVPQDAVVAGNPWTGSSLAYAVADRKTLQLHIKAALPPEGEEIINDLNEANSDPQVCKAVQQLHVTYVLDFGHKEVHGEDHGYKGLDGLVHDGVAEQVDVQGKARLLKITACGE